MAGALVAIVGCQAGGPGTDRSGGAASESPAKEAFATPEPTIITQPDHPPAANENSPAGAIAFTQHYRELYEYGTATGDWGPLQQVTSGDCQSCAELWNPRGYFETRGGHPPFITYDDADIVDLSLRADSPFVAAWIETPAGRWVSASGDEPRKVGSERWGVRFYLEWSGNAWIVEDLEVRELSDERELDYIW